MQRNEPIDAETLLSTPLPPVRWLIPGLLPAGLSLLAGASEHGLCVADGQPFAAAYAAAPTGTTPSPDFSREAAS